ncbi:hypothetical protein Vadar_020167 [Vaccinium darrowii]|uniref:Uncharacterized protein n=1 Tax=Vaccinium darrowii TaxID=229202 RepID=A0ACB7Y1U5_9ERIC|nr:hypothetical protein Vadar_020167 [Vaccinium darrowii]
MPQLEKFLKKKSHYVQKRISKPNLEQIWKLMSELKKPMMTFNHYGGRMSEISKSELCLVATLIFKIQYSVNWKEGWEEVVETNLERIRRLYDYMTPYV